MRIRDAAGNNISMGTLIKINFPWNEAKQFKRICLQRHFNLDFQPVLSDNVFSHLSTYLFIESRWKQHSGKKFLECLVTTTLIQAFKSTLLEGRGVSVNGYTLQRFTFVKKSTQTHISTTFNFSDGSVNVL